MQGQAVAAVKQSSEKPAVVVDGITKAFVIPHERKTTLFENLKGALRPSTYEKFTALNDVSFTVARGDSVGIIGDNGSGKSTLLKVIAKILRPDAGSVLVNGRVTPFLELGVGFQMDLTARENIEVYSTIMGLPEKTIRENLDSVLEFAGLTRFRDTRLKNFSSGMQVRLAFATAIQVKPDILLVDEVLAVGDMEFQQKCLDVFSDYKKKGVTMLFVSHDLAAIRRFCDKALLLKDGSMVAYGKTAEVIDRYVYGVDRLDQAMKETPREPGPEKKNRWGNGKVLIGEVTLIDKFGRQSDIFNSGDPLRIRIRFSSSEAISDPIVGIAIYTEDGLQCYGSNTDIAGIGLGILKGERTIEVDIPALPLISGKFLLTVAAHTRDHIPYDWHDRLYSFTVVNTGRSSGLIDMRSVWVYE